jgi:hypothetical protein
MEIKSNYNAPSFGMAFIKPHADEIDGFMKDVYGKKSIKKVNKALSQLVKREQNNPYDIYYRPANSSKGSAFCVKNKGDSKTYEYAVKGASYPTEFEGKMSEYDTEMAMARNCIKRAFVTTKAIFSVLKEVLRSKFGVQTDILPPALREAADCADKMNRELIKDEKRVNGINKAWKN